MYFQTEKPWHQRAHRAPFSFANLDAWPAGAAGIQTLCTIPLPSPPPAPCLSAVQGPWPLRALRHDFSFSAALICTHHKHPENHSLWTSYLYTTRHTSRMALPAPSPSHWVWRGGKRTLWVWEDSFPNSLCGSFFSVTHCGTWQPRICERMAHVGYPFTQLFLSDVVSKYHSCHLGSKA